MEYPPYPAQEEEPGLYRVRDVVRMLQASFPPDSLLRLRVDTPHAFVNSLTGALDDGRFGTVAYLQSVPCSKEPAGAD